MSERYSQEVLNLILFDRNRYEFIHYITFIMLQNITLNTILYPDILYYNTLYYTILHSVTKCLQCNKIEFISTYLNASNEQKCK